MRPEAGKALGGRYRLVRQIAVGGMGEVWVARDESLAREIAIKVLKQEFVGNADFLNRFRVEARNSASLSHANIAQLYDYGEQDGSAYLVMELVTGEPMSDFLERELTVPIGRLLSILAQTSRALHAAHVGGVVHRDIKPGNILLEESGDVKITDFGVSLAANQIPMTEAGMVMGTAQYLSPEQALGQAATGVSDVYALGIVAYEAIVGRRPFTGKTPVDIAIAHVNEAVPLLPAKTDPELAALILKMLAKDPVNRPRSAAVLAHTFESISKRLAPNTPAAKPATDPVERPALRSGASHSPLPIPTSSAPKPGARSATGPAPKPTPRTASKTGSKAAAKAAPKPAPQPASRLDPTRSAIPAPTVVRSRSQARASSVRPIGPPAQTSFSAPNRAQSGPASPARRSQPEQSFSAPRSKTPARGTRETAPTAAPGLVQRIKNLGVFTLSLVFIVLVILTLTIIQALKGENGSDSAAMQVSDTQTVQFSSEQYVDSELGPNEVLVSSYGDQPFPKVKDAKW